MDKQTQGQIQQNATNAQFTTASVPFHTHNGSDSNQLNPAIALQGFPVVKVSDATIAPTDNPLNGTFRYLVDSTPNYYLWSYLLNPSTNKTGWVGTQIGNTSLKKFSVSLIQHTNSTGSYVLTADTYTCGFIPVTIIFNGIFSSPVNSGTNYMMDGFAEQTASTNGMCSYSFGSGSSFGLSVGTDNSKLGIGYGSSYISVTAWNSTSVEITQNVYGFGSGSTYFQGNILILG